MQEEFRSQSWRKNWPFYVAGSWVLLTFSCARVISNWSCQEFGKEFCTNVINELYPFEYETAQLSMPGYCIEVIISTIAVLFLTGPRVDCNLGHWVVKRLPPAWSPPWLKDEEDNVKLSGVGEFWLYKAALTSAFFCVEVFVWAGAESYKQGGMTTIA